MPPKQQRKADLKFEEKFHCELLWEREADTGCDSHRLKLCSGIYTQLTIEIGRNNNYI